jgi:NAD+ synthase (glutamine-hydrolysing)
MRVALVQFDSWVGGISENLLRIETLIRRESRNADLFVLPELSLVGYPPRDLLAYPHILKAEVDAVAQLQALSAQEKIGILVNHCEESEKSLKGLWNCATLFDSGKNLGNIRKQRLPFYDIFEEERFFSPYTENQKNLEFRGTSLGVFICEDAWDEIAAFGKKDLRKHSLPSQVLTRLQTADLLINISASPFYLGKIERREAIFQKFASELKKPLLYVNSVGAQDDILFDGRSFALDARGKVLGRAACFVEDLLIADIKTEKVETRVPTKTISNPWEELALGIQLGIRDYVEKTGFQKVILGLSGGIDSALVALLAARALGPENVQAVSIPTKFNSAETKKDARDFAQALGIQFQEISIQPMVDLFTSTLKISDQGLTHENLQSRIRGVLLMALSSQNRTLLLAGGNKSELAMGYSTLYGDLCGALLPIGDLYKTEVYALARWLNDEKTVFPASMLERAPSAELAPNQKDSDSLPEYPILDTYLTDFVENQAREALKWVGFPEPSLKGRDLFIRHAAQEFKRRQTAPVLKVHQRSFGAGWKMPVVKALLPENLRKKTP